MSSLSKGILSNYQINRVLGKGTFSIVKLATDIRTNEKIAIKILEKSKIKSSRDYNRINREINILKKINHLNVVQVFEIKEDLEKYYIIMEYCEKGELFDLILSKRKLSEDESAYYFYQLVNGLEYIHLNNIIHRDLKPENLLLTKNYILKIIDFGLSNFNPGDNLLSTPCGSPCYASPEMVSGKKYNGFTNDIWSIGIILYAMIYGYLPFENVNNNNAALFKKIKECKVDYPKNNCLLALDLIKQILVPDFKQRIIISEIKRHKFYIKGRNIFKRRHRDIYLETGVNFNLSNNDNRINKAIKKYSNSEISSRLNDIYEKEHIINYKRNTNNNYMKEEISKNNQRILNKRSINNKSPEIIIRNNNKYSTKSQSKDRKIASIEKNYFSILTTNNANDRETFNYNINNKTEIKLNKKNIIHNSQRSSNYRLIPPKKNETSHLRIKVNPKNEGIYPSSNIIEFSEKFPDFNSFSVENENDYFNEPHSNIKKNRQKEQKENYRSSEIKMIKTDKNKMINDKNRNDKNKFKEIKPISVINLRPKNEFINKLTSPDKNELNFNLVKTYGTNRSHVKIKYNNENMKNKENISLNNNFYFNNNNFLNISNEHMENNKYNSTYVPISHVRHTNSNSLCDKYFNMNQSNLRPKNSEDKLKNKFNNERNKRMETSTGKNNYSHNCIEIFPGSNNKSKKLSSSNFKSNNNFSSINNDTKNLRIKNYRRINTSNLRQTEETKEKQKEEKNKNPYYSNKNINIDNKYNNRQSEIKKIEKSQNHHETYIYVHRNTKEINHTNDYLKNSNRYRINNKDREEISKVNISYENQNKYDKYSRKNNKLNINKFNMSNLPSITIDMNVLNKNNNKYLKLYDAIKNKL